MRNTEAKRDAMRNQGHEEDKEVANLLEEKNQKIE